MILRDAVVDDVPALLAMVRELAAFEQLAHQVVATEAGMVAGLFGDAPAAHVIVAEADGALWGYALTFFTWSTFAGARGLYLEDLYVRPAARGSGLGARLLAQVAARAVAHDCKRLEGTVLDWNTAAQAVYAARGAVPMEGWTTWRVAGSELAALAGA